MDELTISAIRVQRVHGILDQPVGNSHCGWRERSWVRLTLTTVDGIEGRGEAWPLPGYSPDTIDQAESALAVLPELPMQLDLTEPLSSVSHSIGLLDSRVPSARFALESALLDLSANALGVPLPRLLGPSDRNLQVAHLLTDWRCETALVDLEALMERGGTAIKVKVGRAGELDGELAFLRTIRKSFPTLAVRVDANGAWSGPVLDRAIANLAELDLELVEEPGPIDEVLALVRSGVPIGLDESLSLAETTTIDAWLNQPSVAALVLKPTILGGVLRCWELAEKARSRDKRVIWSHTFEGARVWDTIAAWALAWGDDSHAQGLGPHAGWALDRDYRPCYWDPSLLCVSACKGTRL